MFVCGFVSLFFWRNNFLKHLQGVHPPTYTRSYSTHIHSFQLLTVGDDYTHVTAIVCTCVCGCVCVLCKWKCSSFFFFLLFLSSSHFSNKIIQSIILYFCKLNSNLKILQTHALTHTQTLEHTHTHSYSLSNVKNTIWQKVFSLIKLYWIWAIETNLRTTAKFQSRLM